MAVYDVEFKRTEYGFVTVDAVSEAEACEKAIEAYHRGEAGFNKEEISDIKPVKVDRNYTD